MTVKQEVQQELEQTRMKFLVMLDSIPESDYSLPTKNSAWTVGDVLYHITLGPRALALEVWMIVHVRGLFQFGLKYFPSGLFNQINARFARKGERISRQSLMTAYGKAHAVIRSRLRRTREADFSKAVAYPAGFVADLTGEVSVERLFRYVKGHFESHALQLRK